MKGPLFQLICWTYTFLLWIVVCDGKVSYGGGMSPYLRNQLSYQLIRSQFKFQGSRDSVGINSNGEVQVTNEQVTGTEVAQTEAVTLENGGQTYVDKVYERERTLVEEETVVEPLIEEQLVPVEQEGVDFLGQPQVIYDEQPVTDVMPQVRPVEDRERVLDDEPQDVEYRPRVMDEMPQVIEEQPTEIIITTQYYAGVVCHYQVATLFFYDDAYKVHPENINMHLCNTLIASYAILDYNTFTIQANSVEEEAIFLRLTELKTATTKVLLEFEIMAYYGTLVDLLTNNDNIDTFVSSVISYLLAFGFDGLQLPALIPDDEMGNDQDYSYIRDGYLTLVQELGNAFYEHELILSVALPRQPLFIEIAYNLQEMLNYVSFFYLISLDYNNNESSGYLMRTAPLTAEILNDYSYVDYSVTYLLREMNIPSYYLVMALPMYGSSFILQSADKRYFGDEYVDLGPPGPAAYITGILIFSELCSLINTDWPIDDTTITDYEDVSEILEKVLYARTKQLAGVGIMSITMDDPRGDLCGYGPMPFTALISKAFNSNNAWSCQSSLISLENLIDPSVTMKYTG